MHATEIEWIAALQSLGHLKRFVSVLTDIAHGSIPYLLPFIYLGISRTVGQQFYLMLSLNSCVSWILKSALHWPRPFWDARIKPLDKAAFYGMPSGHAQGTAAFWGYAATFLCRWWAWTVVFLMIGMVGFARVYLGAHFISDILGGALAGLAVAGSFRWADTRWSSRIAQLRSWQQFVAVCMATAVLFLVGFVPSVHLPTAEFDSNASGWDLHLTTLRPLVKVLGPFFATGTAIIVANRLIPFSTSGPLLERALRGIFALAGIELINYLFGRVGTPGSRITRALMSITETMTPPFWLLVGAPLLLRGADLLRAGQNDSVREEAPVRSGSTDHAQAR